MDSAGKLLATCVSAMPPENRGRFLAALEANAAYNARACPHCRCLGGRHDGNGRCHDCRPVGRRYEDAPAEAFACPKRGAA